MKIRIFAVVLLVCMLTVMLTACGEMTPEKAEKIVLKDLGVSAGDVETHVHVGTHEGKACYSIYVTIEGKTLEYLVDSETGEILAIKESSHSH